MNRPVTTTLHTTPRRAATRYRESVKQGGSLLSITLASDIIRLWSA